MDSYVACLGVANFRRVSGALRTLTLAAICAVVLAGCGGGRSDSPTAMIGPTETPTMPPATATPVPPATVGKVVWTTSVDPNSNAPGKSASRLTTDAATIYAVVSVSNLRPGSVLSAAWTYNDVSLNIGAASVVPSTEVAQGYVQFHLARGADAPWPSGTYAIAISLDGKPVRTAKIDIVDS